MRITYDSAKRVKTLEERGLDMRLAGQVFVGKHFTAQDTRLNYGEPRYISIGEVSERVVVLVWTPRGRARRIISMRKANVREQTKYAEYLDGLR
ncbi:BrnT family toxin [Pusillimonas sp. CC-YST705]|uniref:BrnT family toxin n=1 Tax=Mesopusillimonas faecipullorum TaxID=2755040 RepID=A0ABS8CA09_9BURK|nr:BrnT family toxin [Mesopusillimonas faecipullorum]MCB5362674.1 BrnT family toxin [Mesopusillimonas faecipullorum]